MSFVTDPTVAGFNSYVSIMEADDYFSGMYFGDVKKWSTFTDVADKQALLVTATRKLSALPWKGTPFAADQLLAFPRNFSAVSEYGYSYFPNVAPVPLSGWLPTVNPNVPATYIPGWLKQAVCEMAVWLWTEGDRPATDAEFAMLKSAKIGPLDYTFRDNHFGLPLGVNAILSGLGIGYIDLYSGARSLSIVY